MIRQSFRRSVRRIQGSLGDHESPKELTEPPPPPYARVIIEREAAASFSSQGDSWPSSSIHSEQRGAQGGVAGLETGLEMECPPSLPNLTFLQPREIHPEGGTGRKRFSLGSDFLEPEDSLADLYRVDSEAVLVEAAEPIHRDQDHHQRELQLAYRDSDRSTYEEAVNVNVLLVERLSDAPDMNYEPILRTGRQSEGPGSLQSSDTLSNHSRQTSQASSDGWTTVGATHVVNIDVDTSTSVI